MHKALYRKWRPQVFDDVVGQDYIVTVLKNQAKTGKIGHAYLFTGTRGTGKTTCAKIFAKAINCENNNSGDPCLECDICESISSGSNVDVVEIDAASHTGVDNIRDIIEQSAFLPALCKYRVYIIDEVHMLSTSAFNALLKIMEEPPAHVIFILATTEVHQVPVTIVSRCQRFDFSRIADDVIVSRLMYVAKNEGIMLDDDAAQVIAYLADGGMRDALSLFDQCASFDNHVTREVISKVSGQADREFISELANAISAENTAEALRLANAAHKKSLSFGFIVSELISLTRDIMIAKAVGISDKELFSASADLEYIEKLSKQLDSAKIMYWMDTLSDTLNSLGRSAYPNILFEQCVIRLCSPFLVDNTKALLTRIEKLERRISSVPVDFSPFSASATSESKSEKVEKAETKKAVQSVESTEKLPFTLWQDVLETLSSTNAPLYGALKLSKAFIEGDVVYIDTNDFTFALLKGSAENRNSLKAAVAQISGKPLKIAQYKEKQYHPGDPMAELLRRAKTNGIDVE